LSSDAGGHHMVHDVHQKCGAKGNNTY
jgi:hypothetical protein